MAVLHLQDLLQPLSLSCQCRASREFPAKGNGSRMWREREGQLTTAANAPKGQAGQVCSSRELTPESSGPSKADPAPSSKSSPEFRAHFFRGPGQKQLRAPDGLTRSESAFSPTEKLCTSGAASRSLFFTMVATQEEKEGKTWPLAGSHNCAGRKTSPAVPPPHSLLQGLPLQLSCPPPRPQLPPPPPLLLPSQARLRCKTPPNNTAMQSPPPGEEGSQ